MLLLDAAATAARALAERLGFGDVVGHDFHGNQHTGGIGGGGSASGGRSAEALTTTTTGAPVASTQQVYGAEWAAAKEVGYGRQFGSLGEVRGYVGELLAKYGDPNHAEYYTHVKVENLRRTAKNWLTSGITSRPPMFVRGEPTPIGAYTIKFATGWRNQQTVIHETAHVLATMKTGWMNHGAAFQSEYVRMLQGEVPPLATAFQTALGRMTIAAAEGTELSAPVPGAIPVATVHGPDGTLLSVCWGPPPSEAAAQQLAKRLGLAFGDVAGHDFHGNQWEDVGGGGTLETAATHQFGTTDDALSARFVMPSGRMLAAARNTSSLHGAMAQRITGARGDDKAVEQLKAAGFIRLEATPGYGVAMEITTPMNVAQIGTVRAAVSAAVAAGQDGQKLFIDVGSRFEGRQATFSAPLADHIAIGRALREANTAAGAPILAAEHLASAYLAVVQLGARLHLGDSPGHDFHGNQWTGGLGGGSAPHGEVIGGVLHTDNVYAAASALLHHQPVSLNQPRQVSTLLDLLAKQDRAAQAAGHKAGKINLAQCSVPGTNLFAIGNKGIDRIDMPQLSTDAPVPGTHAADVAAANTDHPGRADLTQPFIDSLRATGTSAAAGTEQASYLRATQNELGGRQVGGMMTFIEGGSKGAVELANRPIIVSKDNYILDGHHTWAAVVGVNSRDNNLANDPPMNILRVDMNIIPLIDAAKAYAAANGIPATVVHAAELAFGDVAGHDFHGNQHTGGIGGGGVELEAHAIAKYGRTTDIAKAAFLTPSGAMVARGFDKYGFSMEHVDMARELVGDRGKRARMNDAPPTITAIKAAGFARLIAADSAREGRSTGTNMIGVDFTRPLTGAQVSTLRAVVSTAAATSPDGILSVGVSTTGDLSADASRTYFGDASFADPVAVGRILREANQAAGAPILNDEPFGLRFGDTAGHDFHGNQWTGGIGGGAMPWQPSGDANPSLTAWRTAAPADAESHGWGDSVHAVQQQLADRSGLSLTQIEQFQNEWSSSSTGTAHSAALQLAVADQFHLPLSDAERAQLLIQNDGSGRARGAFRDAPAYVAAQYAITQEWYAAHGITEVHVTRGISSLAPYQLGAAAQAAALSGVTTSWSTTTVADPPLGCWTLDPAVAVDFATNKYGTAGGGRQPYQIAATVPASSIFSNGLSGLGVGWVSEHVVISQPGTVSIRALSSSTARALVTAAEKKPALDLWPYADWLRELVAAKPPGAVDHLDAATAAARQLAEPVRMGDSAGHDFHGNQWTGGLGGGAADQTQWNAAVAATNVDSSPGEQEDAFYVYYAEKGGADGSRMSEGRTFASQAEMQTYANGLMATYAPGAHLTIATVPGGSPILDDSMGITVPGEAPNTYTITMNDRYMNQQVLVHEVSHVIAMDQTGVLGHGQAFRDTYHQLLAAEMPAVPQLRFRAALTAAEARPVVAARVTTKTKTIACFSPPPSAVVALAERLGVTLPELYHMGDVAGHDFHGNQHTGGIGGTGQIGRGSVRDPTVVLGGPDSVGGAALRAYMQKGGRVFTAAPLPAGVKKGAPKNCYQNATNLAMDDRSLRYVEGWVQVPGLPAGMAVLHAWAADAKGNVIDNTLPEPQYAQYFGRVYDTGALLKHIVGERVYGVLGGKDASAAKVVANGGL